jgi:uncharacterized protein
VTEGCLPYVRPRADALTGHYWRLGANGRLHLQQCTVCGHFNHPPSPICRACHSRLLCWTPVSGRGSVYSYGVNERPWGRSARNAALGVVELEEQPGLRIFAEISCPKGAQLLIGSGVKTIFVEDLSEPDDPLYIPCFEVASDSPEAVLVPGG